MVLFNSNFTTQDVNVSKFYKQSSVMDKFRNDCKKRNVKNSDFILALHNLDLDGINPFRDDLEDDVKAAILEECKVNPWYYFREIVGFDTFKDNTNPVNSILFLWGYFAGMKLLRVHANDIEDREVITALVNYLIKYGDLGNNIIYGQCGLMYNPVDELLARHETDPEFDIPVMHCNSYVTNEYTGRCVRTGDPLWSLTKAKYSAGILDLSYIPFDKSLGYILGARDNIDNANDDSNIGNLAYIIAVEDIITNPIHQHFEQLGYKLNTDIHATYTLLDSGHRDTILSLKEIFIN